MTARGEETVARVLDRALELWEREGEAGFNVHAIARASSTSVGSLYHHFGSMDALAAHLYARCLAGLLDRIIAALDGARTPKQVVARIVEGYLAFTKESPARARFIHASAYASFLPAHLGLVVAQKAPRLEVIRASLRPHVERGWIVPLSEPLMEMLLIGPAAETTRRWLAGEPGLDLDEAAHLLPERLWHALRAPRPRAPTRRVKTARRRDR